MAIESKVSIFNHRTWVQKGACCNKLPQEFYSLEIVYRKVNARFQMLWFLEFVNGWDDFLQFFLP